MGIDGFDLVKDFLSNITEPRLIADMLEALAAEGANPGTIHLYESYLGHPHHRVRASALTSIVKNSLNQGHLETALENLAEMIRTPEPLSRSTAAVAMGSIGLPMFVPALARLSEDPEEEVMKNAFLSLARLRTPGSLDIVAKGRLSPGLRGKIAENVWAEASRDNLAEMTRLFRNLDAQERKQLGTWLRTVDHDKALSVLNRVLRLENREIRENLLSSLGNLEEEKLRLLSESLTDTDPALVDFTPLIRALANVRLRSLPSWVELISILGGASSPALLDFLRSSLAELNRELFMAFLARERRLQVGPMDADAIFITFELKVQVFLHLVALASIDPPGILDGFKKARSPDGFLQSLALEFLEGKLPRELCSQLQPVLQYETKPAMAFSLVSRICDLSPALINDDAIINFLQRPTPS